MSALDLYDTGGKANPCSGKKAFAIQTKAKPTEPVQPVHAPASDGPRAKNPELQRIAMETKRGPLKKQMVAMGRSFLSLSSVRPNLAVLPGMACRGIWWRQASGRTK